MPPLTVGDRTFETKTSVQGKPYYDFSSLAGGRDNQVIAYVNGTSFTFKHSQRVTKQTADGKIYGYWRQANVVNTRIQPNAKGEAGVNVFHATTHGSLQNVTFNPVLAVGFLTELKLEGAYQALFADCYQRAMGREHSKPVLLGSTVKATRGSLPAALVLVNAYPAFAEFLAYNENFRTELLGTASTLPKAFLPYLREASWDRMIQKLFGRNLPAAAAAQLTAQKVNLPDLFGAYVVRSMVPVANLLDYPIYRRKGGGERLPLDELRRILRACTPDARKELLRTWLATGRLATYGEFFEGISYSLALAEKYNRRVIKFETQDVKNWQELTGNAKAAYNQEINRRYMRDDVRRVRFWAMVNEAFLDLPVGPESGESYCYQEYSPLRKFVALNPVNDYRSIFADTRTGGVDINAYLFPAYNLFPAGSPLNNPARLLHSEKVQPAMKEAKQVNVSYQQATTMLIELLRVLDSTMQRHHVMVTRANRTRLFMAFFNYHSSRYARETPEAKRRIPELFYELVGGSLPVAHLLDAFRLQAPQVDYEGFLELPRDIRDALLGNAPEVDPVDLF